MNLSIFSTIIFILLTALNFPQNKYSIEGSAGIISPINSSPGLSFSGQANYSISNSIQLFLNISFSNWDKYNLYYSKGYYTSDDNNFGPEKTFNTDDHSLISFYTGSRFKLHENKVINLFLDTQIGASYFSYNNYKLIKIIDPETGSVYISPEYATATKKNKTLLTFGVGPLFERKINSVFSLFLSAKINTMINAGGNNFISERGTYFLVSAGFTHTI